MRVCQINCVYGEGSTGKIVRDIHLSLMNNDVESYVICPYTSYRDYNVQSVSDRFLNNVSAVFKMITGNQFGGSLLQTLRTIKFINKIKPDVVHIHCINGNNFNIFRLLGFLAKRSCRVIYTIHAEFPYTGGCGHAYDCDKWKSGCEKCARFKEISRSLFFDRTAYTWKRQNKTYMSFHKNKLVFTTVSPWLRGRAQQSPMLKSFDIRTVLNGVDTTVFSPSGTRELIAKKHGIKEGTRILFHATASFNPMGENLKGGKFILELAHRFKNENIVIMVAANHASFSSLPENVVFIGRINSQKELANYYSAADATLLLSKRETFSMPLAESLCCGTPVVGFKAGGPESIALNGCCSFVEYGDIEGLVEAITTLYYSKESKDSISEKAKQLYCKEKMIQSYVDLYQ